MVIGIVIGIGLVVLFAVVLLWGIATYNRFVRLRVDCDNGMSQIDVQLKRRYDLIPNLVETVKGYASHERETLEGVIEARNKAQQVPSDMAHAAEKSIAENMFTQAIGRLFALSEAYPDLKANQSFQQLQEELSSTENKISYARQHYNDTVAKYETHRMQFPSSVIAGMFNMAEGQYFELEDKGEREAPKVSFS